MSTAPTLAGFQAFIVNQMAIPTDVLPTDSFVIPMALSVALAIVNPLLKLVGYCPPTGSGLPPVSIYTLAAYNLAGSNVLNYAQDAPDAPIYKDNLPYFAYQRKVFNINAFVPGVINSTSDETTSAGYVVQKAAEAFTLANLQQLKDPWGRQYLAFAQSVGPTVIGVN